MYEPAPGDVDVYTQVGAAGAGHCPDAAFLRTTSDGSVTSAGGCQALCSAEADCFFVSYRLGVVGGGLWKHLNRGVWVWWWTENNACSRYAARGASVCGASVCAPGTGASVCAPGTLVLGGGIEAETSWRKVVPTSAVYATALSLARNTMALRTADGTGQGGAFSFSGQTGDSTCGAA